MPEPLVLYSANTLLAYRINQHYYGGIHFVWCSPFFASPASSLDTQMPPSSTPCEICRTLQLDVGQSDLHSAKVKSVREGIRHGAEARHKQGLIHEEQRTELEAIVEAAPLADFRPLLYVIPFGLVAGLAQRVPAARRAHPFSEEFLLERLPRASFDVLDWQWR